MLPTNGNFFKPPQTVKYYHPQFFKLRIMGAASAKTVYYGIIEVDQGAASIKP